MKFTVYPAIDIVDGKCVRLYQGDYSKEKVYGSDPLNQALEFEENGAQWVHIVDLDAARTGDLRNHKLIASIAQKLKIPVQVGGGIRSVETAQTLFEAGVTRIVLGTAAVEQPKLLEVLADKGFRVAVGIDGKDGYVATRGWQVATELKVTDLASRFESSGAETAIVTEIQKDGTLEGPDLKGLSEMLAKTSIQIIASGGLSSMQDLENLIELENGSRKLSGVITGKALYEGVVDLGEALQHVRTQSLGKEDDAKY
ncbi:MAG TPA: 1-(5-phosphoribosyl)-5-[(5-phosphoribosylamino)methylideneamino]imidazole-4-carboxamide isomerase [Acidimicrobiales bacterium]|nr:1-(5-phosphoribosyl)-5-[(5-phosphoribosylamino)methylideneamino]imidazole-4-carboxamide isomerase [Acidimicrobiales bacterium]